MNQIIRVVFDLKIRPSQIPNFKREILHLQDKKADVWHNHIIDDSTTYGEHRSDHDGLTIQGSNYRRYPKIQFRAEKIGDNFFACLWGIADGADAVSEFIHSGRLIQFCWKGSPCCLKVLDNRFYKFSSPFLSPNDNLVSYTLTHFIPFNERRYLEFKSCFLFREKLNLIESLIGDHISLLAEQLNWNKFNSSHLQIATLDLKGFNTVKYMPRNTDYALRFVAVDMIVGLNCQLPPGIAIGNMTSLGYGILRQTQSKGANSLPKVH